MPYLVSASTATSSHLSVDTSPQHLPVDSIPLQKRGQSIEKPTTELYRNKAAVYNDLYLSSLKDLKQPQISPTDKGRTRKLMLEYQRKVSNNLDKARVIDEGNVNGIRTNHVHKQGRANYFERLAQKLNAKASKARRREEYWTYKADGNVATKAATVWPHYIGSPSVYARKAAEQGQKAAEKLQLGPDFAQEYLNRQEHLLLKERAMRSGDPQLASELKVYYTQKADLNEYLAKGAMEKANLYKGQTKAWAKLVKKAEKKDKARRREGRAIFPVSMPAFDREDRHIERRAVSRQDGSGNSPSSGPPFAKVDSTATFTSKQKGGDVVHGDAIVNEASASDTKDDSVHLEKRANTPHKNPSEKLFTAKAKIYFDKDHELAMTAIHRGGERNRAFHLADSAVHDERHDLRHKIGYNNYKAKILAEGNVESIRRVQALKAEKAARHREQAEHFLKEKFKVFPKPLHIDKERNEIQRQLLARIEEAKSKEQNEKEIMEARKKEYMRQLIYGKPMSKMSLYVNKAGEAGISGTKDEPVHLEKRADPPHQYPSKKFYKDKAKKYFDRDRELAMTAIHRGGEQDHAFHLADAALRNERQRTHNKIGKNLHKVRILAEGKAESIRAIQWIKAVKASLHDSHAQYYLNVPHASVLQGQERWRLAVNGRATEEQLDNDPSLRHAIVLFKSANKYRAQSEAWEKEAIKAEKSKKSKRVKKAAPVYLEPLNVDQERQEIQRQLLAAKPTEQDEEAIKAAQTKEYMRELVFGKPVSEMSLHVGDKPSVQKTVAPLLGSNKSKGKKVVIDTKEPSAGALNKEPFRLQKRGLPIEKPTPDLFKKKATDYLETDVSLGHPKVDMMSRFDGGEGSQRSLLVFREHRRRNDEYQRKISNNLMKARVLEEDDEEGILRVKAHKERQAATLEDELQFNRVDVQASWKKSRASTWDGPPSFREQAASCRAGKYRKVAEKAEKYRAQAKAWDKLAVKAKKKLDAKKAEGIAVFPQRGESNQNLIRQLLRTSVQSSGASQSDSKAAIRAAYMRALVYGKPLTEMKYAEQHQGGEGKDVETDNEEQDTSDTEEKPGKALRPQKRADPPVLKLTAEQFIQKAAKKDELRTAAANAVLDNQRDGSYRKMLIHQRKCDNNVNKAKVLSLDDVGGIARVKDRKLRIARDLEREAHEYRVGASRSQYRADYWTYKAQGEDGAAENLKNAIHERPIVRPADVYQDKAGYHNRMARYSERQGDKLGAEKEFKREQKFLLKERAVRTNSRVDAAKLARYYLDKVAARKSRGDELANKAAKYTGHQAAWAEAKKVAEKNMNSKSRKKMVFADPEEPFLVRTPVNRIRQEEEKSPAAITAAAEAAAKAEYIKSLIDKAVSLKGVRQVQVEVDNVQAKGQELKTDVKDEPFRHLQKRAKIEKPTPALFQKKAQKYAEMHNSLRGAVLNDAPFSSASTSTSSAFSEAEQARRRMKSYRRKYRNNVRKATVLSVDDVGRIMQVRDAKLRESQHLRLLSRQASVKANRSGRKSKYWSIRAKGKNAGAFETKLGRPQRPVVHSAEYYRSKAENLRHLLSVNQGPEDVAGAQVLQSRLWKSLLKEKAVRLNSQEDAEELKRYYESKAAARHADKKNLMKKSKRYEDQMKLWAIAAEKALRNQSKKSRKTMVFPEPATFLPKLQAPKVQVSAQSEKRQIDPAIARAEYMKSLISVEKAGRLNAPSNVDGREGVEVDKAAKGEETMVDTASDDDRLSKSAFLQKRGLKNKPKVEKFKEKAVKYDELHASMPGMPSEYKGLPNVAVPIEEQKRREKALEYKGKHDNNLMKARVLEDGDVLGIENVQTMKTIAADRAETASDRLKGKAARSRARKEYWTYKSKGNDAAAKRILSRFKTSRPLIHDANTYAQKAAEGFARIEDAQRWGEIASEDDVARVARRLKKEVAVKSGSRDIAATLADHYRRKTKGQDEGVKQRKQKAKKLNTQKKAWANAEKDARKRRERRDKDRRMIHPNTEEPIEEDIITDDDMDLAPR
jgi:hypothetical protein